jgi:restriction system protein
MRRKGELTREACALLRNHPEGLQASDLLRELEERVPPTPHEDGEYPSNPGVRRYGKIVRFASINIVKAGWLVKDKGIWALTAEGAAALDRFPDPEEFYREAKRLYRAWAKERTVVAGDEGAEADSEPEGEALTSFEEAEEAAWSEIRRHVAEMPPYDFQDLVAALLKAMNYHVAWVSPPGPDRGIDLIAYSDPLGTSNPRIVVQVKRRAADSRISADELRSFMAVLGDRDVGIYIASGGFTNEAEREARSQERRRLTLVDTTRLVELWIEHYARLDDTDRQRLPLKPVYFLAPTAS